MIVHFEDQGDTFKNPFRFLPYCSHCGAELSTNESPCRKCHWPVEWIDPCGDKPAESARELADKIEREYLISDHYCYDNAGVAALIAAHDAKLLDEAAARAENWRRAFGEYHQNDLLRRAVKGDKR